jgi:hypothetical protein
LGTIPSDPVDRGAAFIAMRPLDQFLRVEIRSSLLLLLGRDRGRTRLGELGVDGEL